MAYFTLEEARAASSRERGTGIARTSALESLNEETAMVRDSDIFDIFLSHSLVDAEVIRGVRNILQDEGWSVYVDWIVDAQLDRTAVTPETADVLRRRMRQSSSMFFASSEASPKSRWMPWELGYFDGLRQGRIAVLPLVQSKTSAFAGQEYLGLYPLVERLPTKNGERRTFVTKGMGQRSFMRIGRFASGEKSFETYGS